MANSYYRKFAEKTGFVCALCGQRFAHTGVVSREHMIPKSRGGHKFDVLPAHMRCNAFRGTASLIKAMVMLEASHSRDPSAFYEWANADVRGHKAVPYRDPPNLTRKELELVHGPQRRFRKMAA